MFLFGILWFLWFFIWAFVGGGIGLPELIGLPGLLIP